MWKTGNNHRLFSVSKPSPIQVTPLGTGTLLCLLLSRLTHDLLTHYTGIRQTPPYSTRPSPPSIGLAVAVLQLLRTGCLFSRSEFGVCDVCGVCVLCVCVCLCVCVL